MVVNVNDGTMTVSSGPRSSSIADSSSAEVQEVVSSTSSAPVRLREERAPPGSRSPPPEDGCPLRIEACT